MRAIPPFLIISLRLLPAISCAVLWLAQKPARADFSFVHITDTHFTATDKAGSNFEKNRALYEEISALQPRPAFVANTGDVVEVGTLQEYGFALQAAKILTIPQYAAPGNHDVRWNPLGKEGYQKGTQQPLYQSWDYENVHFVLLDSTVLLQHWGHFDRAMLDWLRADLAKIGIQKPIVIGMHHWIKRAGMQADNEDELLAITAPYNVRLWLIGHGHSDIEWNVNGAPAIMSKGLYQGSYHLLEVSQNEMRVKRRSAKNPTLVPILSIPLAPQTAPQWNATVQPQQNAARVAVTNANLPPGTQLHARLDGEWQPLPESGATTQLNLDTTQAPPGDYRVQVRATLPDGRVYFRSVPFSLRRTNGVAPLWVAPIGGAVQSKLVRSSDTLFVTSMSGALHALDAGTGKSRWKFATEGAIFSTPLVANDTVYFGSADHFVYAVDARNGKLKWKTKTGGAVFASAALSQNVVCIASVDETIYGLDANSGEVKWKAKGDGMYQSQAATDGTRFFVGGWDNYFRAFDVQSGKEIWKNKFGRAFYFAPAIGSPTVDGGTVDGGTLGGGKVFVTSNDGMMHAMDAATGKILWEIAGPSLGYSGPLFQDGKIYNASLTGTGRVFCFDAKDGSKIWETPTGSVIYDSSCAWSDADGGSVYVGCVDGTFYAHRARHGQMRWQFHLPPGHVLASPVADDKRVFISSMNGLVYALPL